MKYVIIGASAAGISAVKGIRSRDKSGEIVLISKDESVYSRCMLHHVISGQRDTRGISFIEEDFFQKYNVEWKSGKNVQSVNTDLKELKLDSGEVVSFDKLLIASGAKAFIPPVKNLREGKQVYPLRDIEDAIELSKVSKEDKVVIVGAGLVGIDAAVGLIEKGIHVEIVEMGDRILPIQLDNKSSEVYEKKIAEHGGKVHTGIALEEVLLHGEDVKGIILGDGTKIDCDHIVVATGVRSNIEFIQETDIEIDRGIVVDSYMSTNADSIFAAGDVTGKTPIWPFAMKQGEYAGKNMVQCDKEFKDDFAQRNSMNFFGIETISVGLNTKPDDSYEEVIFHRGDVYKKIIYKNGFIHGMVLQGDIEYCGIYMQIIKNSLSVSGLENRLFHIDLSDFYGIDKMGSYKLIDRQRVL